MQRRYSLFPRGRPGLGLVLLRVGVAASLAVPLGRADSTAVDWLLGTLMAGVLAGFLTPLFGVLVIVTAVVDGMQMLESGPLLRIGYSVGSALAAASLALLGPGAYSVDAWLYGRRELRLPRR